MPTCVLRAESVHAVAALCDYLDTRAMEDLEVWVVSLSEPANRDLGDIENVLQVRLPGATDITTVHRPGPLEEVIPAVADEISADEIILPHERNSAPDGDHLMAVLANTAHPLVLVPLNESAARP